MKKPILLFATLFATSLPLMGCGENPHIYLHDGSSRFVIQSFDDKGSLPLSTYRYSTKGEVPYAELGQFFYAVGAVAGVRTNVVKVDGGYSVKDLEGHVLLTADPSKDTLSVENFELWTGNLAAHNNGIAPDVGSSDPDESSAVHPSTKTKIHGERKKEFYELAPYHFDVVEDGEKCYVPTQLLSAIFYRWNNQDFLYNGLDFYLSSTVLSATLPAINQSYFANKDRFLASIGSQARKVSPKGNEAYRYAYHVVGEAESYRIMSLTKDGKGLLLEGSSAEDEGKQAVIDGVKYSYTWEERNGALFVNTIATGKDPVSGETGDFPQGISKIPLKDSFYDLSRRPKAIAEFGYDLLRFQFDKFYGLNDVKGFTDFDQFIVGKGLKQGLLSEDPAVYDDALATLMMKDIDDGHTNYILPSIFSGGFTKEGLDLASKHPGTRRSGLLAKQKEYLANRKTALGKDVVNPQGVFIQGDTAVIRFDAFSSQGIYVSNEVTSQEVAANDPGLAFQGGNTPLGFDASFYRIKQNVAVKNVVVDLTCNGGGAVAAIPYIFAHFTADPTMTFFDKAMGITKEFHYEVDLNHDKKYGTAEDTYQNRYKFYILTSDFSFSCATFTPTLARLNGAKVIGQASGGGACTVGGFSDGLGSLYYVSSPQICVAPNKDGKYVHYDAGVPVDHPLDSSSWYDLGKLSTFLNSIAK